MSDGANMMSFFAFAVHIRTDEGKNYWYEYDKSEQIYSFLYNMSLH